MLTSLQCGRQIAQLKEEYEETKKNLEVEASKLRQVSESRPDPDFFKKMGLVSGFRQV